MTVLAESLAQRRSELGLAAHGLSVSFLLGGRTTRATHDVSLMLKRGSTLGIVGESGSGKSVTLRGLVGLLPPNGRLSGRVTLDGMDLTTMSEAALSSIRGTRVGMVFQDPGAGLNPTKSIGGHLTEVLRLKRSMSRQEASTAAVSLLERVGLPDSRRQLRAYPHELSGGMRQRVMIALAVALEPEFLLADEPTTALDVTVQDQVLALLRGLQIERSMGMLLVSHDIEVIGQMCDTVAVMYGGWLVETGSVDQVLDTPHHPYTQALLSSAATLEKIVAGARTRPIVGQPPRLGEFTAGCPFRVRCPHARDACAEVSMELVHVGEGHASACPFVQAS